MTVMTVEDLRVAVGDLAGSTKAFVAEYVGKALGDLQDGLRALERQVEQLKAFAPLPGPPGPQGEPGPAGRDGATVEPRELEGLVKAIVSDTAPPIVAMRQELLDAVRKELATIERPRDGVNGRDGRDGFPGVTIADLLPLIEARITAGVAEAIKALPPPPAGRDGASVTVDDLRPVVTELVAAGLAALPAPRDGRDGLPGVPGPPGEKGMDGTNGRDGKDGLDGATGEKGLDGKDGLGFDNFEFVFSETTGYVARMQNGERVKEWRFATPWYAGVWRATGPSAEHTTSYPQGAEVTYKGSQWIAKTDTWNRPGDSKDWQLACRRGEDGKDAKPTSGHD